MTNEALKFLKKKNVIKKSVFPVMCVYDLISDNNNKLNRLRKQNNIPLKILRLKFNGC